MSNNHELKPFDDEIAKAKRDYVPSSLWDDQTPSYTDGPDAPVIPDAKVEQNIVEKTVDILEEMAKKHLRNFGIMKKDHRGKRMVMWGMNPMQAEIARKALTTDKSSAIYEVVAYA